MSKQGCHLCLSHSVTCVLAMLERMFTEVVYTCFIIMSGSLTPLQCRLTFFWYVSFTYTQQTQRQKVLVAKLTGYIFQLAIPHHGLANRHLFNLQQL